MFRDCDRHPVEIERKQEGSGGGRRQRPTGSSRGSNCSPIGEGLLPPRAPWLRHGICST